MNLLNKTIETLIVTPEQAGIWLEQCVFPGEREIREEWVSELAGLLKADQWEGGLVKFHEVEGVWRQVDGHHRLLAIREAGVAGWLHVERTHNSTWEAARAAYHRTDGGIPRTFSEGLKAADLLAGTDLLPSQCEKLLCAARFIINGYRDAGKMRKSRSNDLKLRMVGEWREETKQFYAATRRISAAVGAPLRGAGPMSVALTLFRHQPASAKAFFEALARNSGLVKGDPIHTLGAYLVNPHTKTRSQAYRARGCAHCWNAWRDGQRLLIVRPCEESELYLHGTPLRPRRQ